MVQLSWESSFNTVCLHASAVYKLKKPSLYIAASAESDAKS